MVIHEKTRSALAIVGQNNPHREEALLCKKTNKNIKWINISEKLQADLPNGVMTYCTLEDLDLALNNEGFPIPIEEVLTYNILDNIPKLI